MIGTNAILLWLVLPIAILLAGIAPAVISFAAGQAGFTLVLVILFNIVQPAGWRVGLLRVEDIAIGCAVSLLVGALFWPRGAAGALGVAMTEAYDDSAGYLAGAVEFGVGQSDGAVPARQPPTAQAARSAAAARRLDDAFRSYLAERGAKPVPLAEVTALVTGVVGLRLAGDAARRPVAAGRGRCGRCTGPRPAGSCWRPRRPWWAWYRDLAASLTGRAPVPAPLPRDQRADQRLVDAVRHDLRGNGGRAGAVAVRMIWTGDHLDAARRFQASLVGPAQTATEQGALVPVGAVRGLLARRARRASSAGPGTPLARTSTADSGRARSAGMPCRSARHWPWRQFSQTAPSSSARTSTFRGRSRAARGEACMTGVPAAGSPKTTTGMSAGPYRSAPAWFRWRAHGGGRRPPPGRGRGSWSWRRSG